MRYGALSHFTILDATGRVTTINGAAERMLGLDGWFSTNILGNRDGEVLDDPDSFKTKEESKLSVLDQILQPDLYPDLYKDFVHKVRIHYYPPRGDNKEGWDNIDIFGWLGYKMQIKIDFLCRDSILAAPIVLDLVIRNGRPVFREEYADVRINADFPAGTFDHSPIPVAPPRLR